MRTRPGHAGRLGRDIIVKNAEPHAESSDPRLRAGAEAERQMAFYLHRDFSPDGGLLILNDLRLVDRDQPKHDCWQSH